jgi:hypothetical protein
MSCPLMVLDLPRHQMPRHGARCVSASRQADVAIGNVGLLSVTFIRRETPKACMTLAQGPDGSRMRPAGCEQATGMADSMTTGLADQDGGDSGTRATASGKRPLLSEPASGKDPL